MGWVKTLWGLIVDDPRLALGVVISLALGWVAAQLAPAVSGWVIIAGLLVSIGWSLSKR